MALVGAFSVIVKTDCETDGVVHSTTNIAWLLAAGLELVRVYIATNRGMSLDKTWAGEKKRYSWIHTN